MTDTQVRIDQRGTAKLISQFDVDRAWADSVGAADFYERCSLFKGGGGITQKQVDDAKRRMLESVEYAEKLQDLYNEQQDELEAQQAETKRVMMVSTPTRTQINPAWCKHENTVASVTGNHRFVNGDVDDDIHEEVYCLDCGSVVEDEAPVHVEIDQEAVDKWIGGEQ
jgi:hypothetical protein